MRTSGRIIVAFCAVTLISGCAMRKAPCPQCPTSSAAAMAMRAGTPEAMSATAHTRRHKATCGRERWDVKTLSDADASSVDLTNVVQTTISDLNALPARCDGGLDDPRQGQPEYTVFEIVGQVTYVNAEADRDFHIAVQDPDAPGMTMVVEVVDPTCPGATSSVALTTLQQSRSMFQDILGNGSYDSLVGSTVRVRGVGFYDKAHGQNGLSNSCIELHPVTSIELLQ